MNRRSLLALVPGIASIAVTSSGIFAQAYPSRPIRLIVPSSPGGAHDIIARLWTERMRQFGAFVVENRSGAGTIIGTVEVARGAPDGYLLLLGSTNTHVLQPLTASTRSYDPLADFAPISILGTTATAIAVTPGLPVNSLQELIAYARGNPGKVALGHSGPGTNTFLSGEMFKLLAGGLDIVSVPYKGAGPSFADLLSGQIQMIVVNVTNQITDFHAAGKITASGREFGFANSISSRYPHHGGSRPSGYDLPDLLRHVRSGQNAGRRLDADRPHDSGRHA